MRYLLSTTGVLAFVLVCLVVVGVTAEPGGQHYQASVSSGVPEPAALDLVETAAEDLVEPAAEDFAEPASSDLVKPADEYGTSMVGPDARCTREAEAKGECMECLGNWPLVPGTKEAQLEWYHSEDCYTLRTQWWRQQQQGGFGDAHDLQKSYSSCTGTSCYGSQNTNYGNSLGPIDASGLAGGFLNPNTGSVLSQLQSQLSSVLTLAGQAGLLGNTSVGRSLTAVTAALDALMGSYQNYQTNTGYGGQYQSTTPSYDTPTYSPENVNVKITGKDLHGVDSTTLKVLDYIASRVDHQLVVTSAFRSDGYNQSVGGASQSQHTHGKAIDLSLGGLSTAQQVRLVKLILSYPDVNGFGYYDNSNSVHFDTRAVRVGKGYWGSDYSFVSFDTAAVEGRINPEIVDTVYFWSNGGSPTP